MPSDPSWKWGAHWFLPYDWQFRDGQTFLVDGQTFNVSGPHSGYTAFGTAIQYWRLVNRDKFLILDLGDLKQYVHPGDVILHYDAANSRLRLKYDVLRREYYKGNRTSNTVHYILNLTSANAISESEPRRSSQSRTHTPVAFKSPREIPAGGFRSLMLWRMLWENRQSATK